MLAKDMEWLTMVVNHGGPFHQRLYLEAFLIQSTSRFVVSVLLVECRLFSDSDRRLVAVVQLIPSTLIASDSSDIPSHHTALISSLLFP